MKWLVALAVMLLVGAMVTFVARRMRQRIRVLPPPTAALVELREELRRDVAALVAIGERNVFKPGSLATAASFIADSFAPFPVERQSYLCPSAGVTVENLIVEIRGSSRPDEIVVIGAHYDSVYGSPGADDNASGVAGLLGLVRRFRDAKPARTVRFVAFANEEPPAFKTAEMGSLQYATRCHERGETIVAMLSLEMLGYYDERKGSQQYPPLLAALYPDTGDFIAFAGNIASAALVRRCVRSFRRARTMHAEAAAVPEVIQQIGWSDQWSFWQFGWPAIMVTDTALFRNPDYHAETDTAETLDYERMARVVEGLVTVVRDLGR